PCEGPCGPLLIAFATSIVALSQALPSKPLSSGARRGCRQPRKPGEGVLVETGKQALKQPAPVAAAKRFFKHPLRVRHHAEEAARSIANAGDVALRAIGVRLGGGLPVFVDVAEHPPPLSLEAIERRRVGAVVAIPMRNRNADDLARRILVGVGSIGL